MDKIYRSIALAVLAAITVGVAANADGCQPPQKKISYRACKRISHRPAKTIAEKPALIKETKVTTTKTIEKPVVINTPAPEVKEVIKEQPAVAVAPAESPVIIDRYVKRHRSLIHLGLFPFNLFGQ